MLSECLNAYHHFRTRYISLPLRNSIVRNLSKDFESDETGPISGFRPETRELQEWRKSCWKQRDYDTPPHFRNKYQPRAMKFKRGELVE